MDDNGDFFYKSPKAIFFGATNPEFPFKQQDGIKKPKDKGSLKEAIVTAGGLGIVSLTKIAYGDFLKRSENGNAMFRRTNQF